MGVKGGLVYPECLAREEAMAGLVRLVSVRVIVETLVAEEMVETEAAEDTEVAVPGDPRWASYALRPVQAVYIYPI